MRKSNQHRFRELLRANPDGLSVSELCKDMGLNPSHALRSLRCMPDAYIDRWKLSTSRKKFSSVWCVVVPPPHCPKPEKI